MYSLDTIMLHHGWTDSIMTRYDK